MDFAKFLTRTCNKSSSSYHLHTELVQTKWSMGTLYLDNHNQFFGSWMIPGSMLSWVKQSINTRFSRSVSEI